MKGFTFIDTMIGVSLSLIIFLGILGAFRLGIQVVIQSQNKIVAAAIANQEIEMARNLSYGEIGTVGAILPFAEGQLLSSKTISRNNIDYTVATRVKYIIDDADGIGAPNDNCSNDYKRMEVEISWQGLFSGNVVLISDMMPENLVQECEQAGGILSISVFDAFGLMVASPFIEIFDSLGGPRLDFATPLEGSYYFPLLGGQYSVVVSKTGYSGSRSYGEDEIATPEKSHPIVIEGGATSISFSIDKLSSFFIRTVTIIDEEVLPVPNIPFNLRGDKIIGLDEDENSVYKYSSSLLTDGNGEITIPDLEWDSYWLSVDQVTGLDLIDTDPSPLPISLVPDQDISVDLYLQAENSLLITTRNQETLEPIFSAEVKIFKDSIFYDETQYTNENGQAFFIPLDVELYDISINALGYTSYQDVIAVSGDVNIIIELEQIE